MANSDLEGGISRECEERFFCLPHFPLVASQKLAGAFSNKEVATVKLSGRLQRKGKNGW